jgi:hypothetical protein
LSCIGVPISYRRKSINQTSPATRIFASVLQSSASTKMSVVKQFYFIGDEPSTAKSVRIAPDADLKALREAVAEVLHVADPNGNFVFSGSFSDKSEL